MDAYELSKGQRRTKFINNRKHPSNKKSSPDSLKGVYEDTLAQVQHLGFKLQASEKINIEAEFMFEPTIEQAHEPIDIRNMDTLDMAEEYVRQKLNPLVLNMASKFKPGGGVIKGAAAQEECIFRRSNAVLTHYPKWYPLEDNEVIYSPKVTIIKDKEYNDLDQTDYWTTAMLAVPAIKNPKTIDGDYADEDSKTLMRFKINAIFLIALKRGHDSLVLGALGCGAYNNPPQIIAEIFKEALKEWHPHFKRIGFAVLANNPQGQQNLEIFTKTLKIEPKK